MAYFNHAAAYPNVAKIVRVNLPAVVKNSRKFNAFKRFGQFKNEKALQILGRPQPGDASSYKPVFQVDNLGTRVWGFYPENGDTLYLSKVVAYQYERLFQRWLATTQYSRGRDALQWKEIVKRAELAIESTLLHEMVHWGDLKDGISQLAEAREAHWSDVGQWFVHEAYGKQFPVSAFVTKKGIVLRQNDLDVQNWLGWDKNGQPFNP
jgi:hypothetical protein